MKELIALPCALFLSTCALAQALEQHHWQDRVILLFATEEGKSQLRQQIDLLTEQASEVTERDLKIYQLLPDKGKKPDGKPVANEKLKALYRVYEPDPQFGFTFILIGKDGTEKLRANQPVSMPKLFGLIDQMPMRQAEMRRQQEQKRGQNQQH